MKRYVKSAANSKRPYKAYVRDFCRLLGFAGAPMFIDPTSTGYRFSWTFGPEEQQHLADEIYDKFGFQVRFTKPAGYLVVPYGALEEALTNYPKFAIEVYSKGKFIGYAKSLTGDRYAPTFHITSKLSAAETYPSQDIAQELVDDGISNASVIFKNTFYIDDEDFEEESKWRSASYNCLPFSAGEFEFVVVDVSAS